MYLLLDPALPHPPHNRDHFHLPSLLAVCVEHAPVLQLPRADPLQLLQGDDDCVECAGVPIRNEVGGQVGGQGWLVHLQKVEQGREEGEGRGGESQGAQVDAGRREEEGVREEEGGGGKG